MGRAPCCDKANVKKGPWSPEEDAKLKDYIHKHGTGGNWIALPQKVGLRRCGKSCRLRWLNYLRPNIKHGEFSDDEDRTICTLFASIGSRWSIIAAQLPGRTDNDIKNYWNTKLKKKLIINIPPTNPINNMRSHQPTMFPSSPNHNPNHSHFSYPPPPPLNSSSPYQQYHPHSSNFTSLISPDSIGGGPDGLLGPARGGFGNTISDHHDGDGDGGDDNLLVFGGERHQDQDFRCCYLRNNRVDDENHKFLFSGSDNNDGYCSSASAAAAAGPINGCSSSSLMSEAPLDYSIEEIKQLISTHSSIINNNNNNFNFFVDDCTIKTEQEGIN